MELRRVRHLVAEPTMDLGHRRRLLPTHRDSN
jgi:hypothetical protein